MLLMLSSSARTASFVMAKALSKAGWLDFHPSKVAETLLKRDREADDRRMCAECSNLVGRQCRNPQGAELGLPSHRTADVSPIRFMLQRCAGFRGDGLTIGNRKPEAGMSSHEIIAA